MTTTTRCSAQAYTRLAAAAPDAHDATDDDASSRNTPLDAHIHQLCEDWARWTRTRRYYAPSSNLVGLLGRLASRTRPTVGDGPSAANNAELHAFNLAISAQPHDMARRVFELHYLHRVKNIKAAASVLGISRRNWYHLLRTFRRRIYAAAARLSVVQ